MRNGITIGVSQSDIQAAAGMGNVSVVCLIMSDDQLTTEADANAVECANVYLVV